MFDSCSFSSLVGCFVPISPARPTSPLCSSALRIIPACAGNTPEYRCRNTDCGDHPRMCGEHNAWYGSTGTRTGSSPHVRGTPWLSKLANRVHGIIPACAGSTLVPSNTDYWIRDHPRACEEHCRNVIVPDGSRGSSPRVRGTRGQGAFHRQGVGIIPARAGSTPSLRPTSHVPWDHPRVCGEHFFSFQCLRVPAGSSPRVRGAQST